MDRWLAGVALRKESVDRNVWIFLFHDYIARSLSARRAWIETFRPPPQVKPVRSLSARRAWIETQVFQRIAKPFRVALRKESVDRNC